MYDNHATNGVIYTDGKSCVYYTLKNGDLSKVSTSSIFLQGQFKNGGQSANRLARIRDNNREFFITQLAEKTVTLFYDRDENRPKVDNIVFCGPAQFKVELSSHRLIKKFFDFIYTLNISDMSNNNYKQIQTFISNLDNHEEKKSIGKIKQLIALADDKLIFGDEIIPLLKSCQIETIYIHKSCIDQLYTNLDYEPTIVTVSSDMILEYGGMIGVKWY